MSKALVACFSASGVTAKLAKALASATDADLFEIKPVTPYTSKDLNWMDKTSRPTIEMQDKSSRPEMAETLSSCAQYDTVFVGFPIWWYEAPHEAAEKEHDGKDRQQQQRRDLRPELALQLFHLESASIL